jgi:hypothetical protein
MYPPIKYAQSTTNSASQWLVVLILNPYHILNVKDDLIVYNVHHVRRVIILIAAQIKVSASNNQWQRFDRLNLTQAVPLTAPQFVNELFNLDHSGASSWFEGLNLGRLCPVSNGLGKAGKGQ